MRAGPRKATNLFPLLLVGILAALSYWLELASRAPETRSGGKLRHDPDSIVENFEVWRYDAIGALQHTLTAERMVHYPDDDTADVSAPRLILHRPPPTTISARAAHIASHGERIELLDEVRITRGSKAGKPETVLATTRMDVWPEEEIAKTAEPVTITQGASRLTGAGGLSVDQKSLIYVLEGPVEGVFFRSPRSLNPAPPAPAAALQQPSAPRRPLRQSSSGRK